MCMCGECGVYMCGECGVYMCGECGVYMCMYFVDCASAKVPRYTLCTVHCSVHS